jgi:hypothetical protein
MSVRIQNVTVNTARPKELAAWWAGAIEGAIAEDLGGYVIVGAPTGPSIAFQHVEGTMPGRIHVDLAADDLTGTVSRLVKSGASHVADRETPGTGFRWVVLADPDGNEFCVFEGH